MLFVNVNGANDDQHSVEDPDEGDSGVDEPDGRLLFEDEEGQGVTSYCKGPLTAGYVSDVDQYALRAADGMERCFFGRFVDCDPVPVEAKGDSLQEVCDGQIDKQQAELGLQMTQSEGLVAELLTQLGGSTSDTGLVNADGDRVGEHFVER